jgi:CBS domain-containing protein
LGGEHNEGPKLEASMKVYDIMSSDVQLITPDDTIQAAAQKMAEADVGFLPVGENDKLVGMVTDRDIALRAVARGKNPASTRVREIMTDKVLYCLEDEDVEEAADTMSNLKIRRLPIVDDDKRLVGVLSLGDIAFKHKGSIAGTTLAHVCDPHGHVR